MNDITTPTVDVDVEQERYVGEEPFEYRPMSALAFAALVLSLFSLVALLWIGLIFLPSLALFLGLLAWWRISRDQAMISGEGVALTAIALSLFVICFSATYHLSVRHYRYALTHQFIDRFFEMLRQGDTALAYQLVQMPEMRMRSADEVERFFSGRMQVRLEDRLPRRPTLELRQFLEREPFKSFLENRETAQVRVFENGPYTPNMDGMGTMCEVVVTMTRPMTQEPTLVIVIAGLRTPWKKGRGADWQLGLFQVLEGLTLSPEDQVPQLIFR